MLPTLKVVLLGDLGVGKTCLRSQFVHHIFTNAYKATIGGDYLTTTIDLPPPLGPATPNGVASNHHEHHHDDLVERHPPLPQQVNLQVWDTAGQERFNSISQAFYRGTDVVVLVYDITNYESVLSIRDWFARFMQHCHVELPGVVIVGNKNDKPSQRVVDLYEIRSILDAAAPRVSVEPYVQDWNTDLREVSAKNHDSVHDLFVRVAQVGLATGTAEPPRGIESFDAIDLHETTSKSSCAC